MASKDMKSGAGTPGRAALAARQVQDGDKVRRVCGRVMALGRRVDLGMKLNSLKLGNKGNKENEGNEGNKEV